MGFGMTIVANKHKDVRGVPCYNRDEVVIARQHNGINVLTLSGKYTDNEDAKMMVDAFLETEAEDGRHKWRREMIELGYTQEPQE
jgi:ribose 5-phosphate isomerase B